LLRSTGAGGGGGFVEQAASAIAPPSKIGSFLIILLPDFGLFRLRNRFARRAVPTVVRRPGQRQERSMAEIRRARREDLGAIVALLADDPLGSSRETISDPPAPEYVSAMEAIESDPNQFLGVMVDGEEVIGTLQLTFIQGLSRRGLKRGLVEAVRIASSRRSEGLGAKLFEWAIEECRNEGCRIVQLTTDRTRTDAHRFYDRLGFEPSHIGYKLML
jgi:GNAT superfamily N-acetyltransferase